MHGVDMNFISFTSFSSHDWYDESMRRQQNILFLCLFFVKQEQIFSHTLHDVAGGEDGIISLAIGDQEVLLPWEKLLMYSNIMGGIFDKEHVKGWGYELEKTYLHGPTTLSLRSLGLLMEYPQDYFTLDALGGQGGGENDGVMDGNIY